MTVKLGKTVAFVRERRQGLLLLAIHVLLGTLTMAALFATVDRRDVYSTSFETTWVEPGPFDNRFIHLVETWRSDGYLSNGGLWKLNGDPWFIASVKGGSPWFQNVSYDAERTYFYRSNSGLFVAPLALADRLVGSWVPIRWTAVVLSQAMAMAAAVLVGLLTARLARMGGTDVIGSTLLGACAQAVYQTNPLILWSYFGIYMQHVFAIPCAAFLLTLAYEDHYPRTARIACAFSVFLMVLADAPHAACTLLAFVFVTAILVPQKTTLQLLAKTLAPAAAGAVVIGAQFLAARWNHPDAAWVGSSLMFRTGLDGDTTYFDSVFRGYQRLLMGPVIPGGKHAAGHGRVFWSVILVAGPLTALCAIWWRRLRPCLIPLATAYGGFILFATIFSNAFAIHPYAYGVLLLVAGVPALFGPVLGGLDSLGGTPRVVSLLAAAVALVLVFAQLRDFARAFPAAPAAADASTRP